MTTRTADLTQGRPAVPPSLESLSLKARAVRGSIWTMGGYGVTQVLRLASNLILTRLLFPEAFGLMVKVQVITGFIKMFSDVGLRASVVQHKRGEDQAFLDTAWTLQAIRGVIMWLVVCLLAFPMAVFYDAPELKWLVPVAGLSMVFAGAKSTSMYSLVRNVTPARNILLQIATRVVALSITITLAVIYRSVWALVIGGVIGSLFTMACSHMLIRGYRNRFALEPEAAKELLRFGGWIFLSTALTFIVLQGDRIVLAKMLPEAQLGVYSIAFFLSMAVLRAMQRITKMILFPVYARLKERGTEEMRRHTARMRLVVLALFLPPAWILAVGGDWMIQLLYDPRYHDAGWMLQILAVGVVGMVIPQTAEGALLAMGDSFRMMLLQAGRAVFTVTGMAVGGTTAGVPGLLLGLAASRLAEYLLLIVLIRRYNLWLPKLDVAAYAVSALAIGGGLALRSAFGLW